MRIRNICLCVSGLLLALPAAVRAQTDSVARRPGPFFVGAGYTINGRSYQVKYDELMSFRPSNWLLVAGYHFTPRLAVQVGYAPRKDRYYDLAFASYTPSGDLLENRLLGENWSHLLPVLARYSLIQRPNPRLQIDALLGATLLYAGYSGRRDLYLNRQLTATERTAGEAIHVYAQAGLGLRYPFGRHFEGSLDWTYARLLRATTVQENRQTLGNDWGLTRTLAVGLRYRFGRGRRA